MSVAVYVMNGVPEQRMGDVCIMNAASFAKLMEDGDKSFRVLQLDLSPDWADATRALLKVDFTKIMTLNALVINHDLGDSDDDAVVQVWECTRKILTSLHPLMGVSSVTVCGPFPRSILQCRSKNRTVIEMLKRRLSSVDLRLANLIATGGLSSLVLVPQIDTHGHAPEGSARPFVFEERARIYEFFPELHSLGYVDLQRRV